MADLKSWAREHPFRAGICILCLLGLIPIGMWAVTVAADAATTQCRDVKANSVLESWPIGTDLGHAKLKVHFCGNGNKVLSADTQINGKLNAAGEASQWFVADKSKGGHYQRWAGSDQGAWVAYGSVRFRQEIGFYGHDSIQSVVITVYANGWTSVDGSGGGGSWRVLDD